ncbi:MAG: glycosyl hydrolase family 28-related protein [Synechococcaceae cyanobacterium]|nr:glycosyl hydrolase family 28-related protein [Synechococcaceae cyanobacterium]
MVQSGLFGQHGSGFQASGSGAVQRHLKDKLAESVSALDFGARGDGQTDDTAAIQRALDAHGLVHLPAGTYLLSDTLVLRRSGGGLVGLGALPALRMTRPGRSALRLAPPPGGLAEWIRVENLALWLGDGVQPSYAARPGDGDCAIAIDGAGSTASPAGVQRALLRNLRLLGWGCGLWMRRHVNTHLERIVVEHWRVSRGAGSGRYVGFSFDGDPAASPPGASLSPQASVEVVGCLFNGDGAPAGVTAIGFHLHGEDLRDVFFDRCETAGGQYGWLVETSSADYDWNIQLRRPIVDRFGRHAIALRDVCGPGAVSLQGGYAVPAASAGAALLARNCSGLAVSGGLQLLGLAGEGAASQGIRLEGCQHCSLHGATLLNQRLGIELADCTACTVSGNSLRAAGSHFSRQPSLDTAIRISGSSRACLISGNTIAGLDGRVRYARGLVVEDSASDCLVVANAVDPASVAEPYRVATGRNGFDGLLDQGVRRIAAPRQELVSSAGAQVYRGSDPAFPHRFEDGQGRELVRLSSGGSWVSRSDQRLKTDIAPLPYGLAELRQLTPRAYRWRPQPVSGAAMPTLAEGRTAEGPSPAPDAFPAAETPAAALAQAEVAPAVSALAEAPGVEAGAGRRTAAAADLPCSPRHFGLLAQEVRGVLPELVAEVGAAGELGLDYGGLLPVLIRAVQELDGRLQQLEGAGAPAEPGAAGAFGRSVG